MSASNATTDSQHGDNRRQYLRDVRTVVVKVGTNVLSRSTGEISLGRVCALVEELVDQQRQGKRVILVTSGAISLGMDRLGREERPTTLPDKQACAAVGQIRLMSTYQQAFDRYGIPTAQFLLTEEDFSSRRRYLNLRNSMSRVIELGVLPIVNENDVVSTSEIEAGPGRAGRGVRSVVFGDNDHLSALVASKLDADLLLVLSDVGGLYQRAAEAAPAEGAAAAPIAVVPEITPEVRAMAGAGNGRGRGGMASKLAAIDIVVQSGIPAVIASGQEPDIVSRVMARESVGTLFLPAGRLSSRKHWIGFASATAGHVEVNAGARDALVDRGSSLLFAGVTAIEDDFRRGDVVSILGPDHQEFARGIANYDADVARALVGKKTAEIAAVAGADYPEFITRDNIALRR